jgi:hypothetical protein
MLDTRRQLVIDDAERGYLGAGGGSEAHLRRFDVLNESRLRGVATSMQSGPHR